MSCEKRWAKSDADFIQIESVIDATHGVANSGKFLVPDASNASIELPIGLREEKVPFSDEEARETLIERVGKFAERKGYDPVPCPN